MRSSHYLLSALLLMPALVACGASDGDTAPIGDDSKPVDTGEKESAGSHYDYGAKFAPADAAEGYTRFVAPVIKDIPPGADITWCQYVKAPEDRDIDILDVTGSQSAGGHHTVAFATTKELELGDSAPCAEGDMDTGFLGGTGGDGAAITLPENTAFRLTKGQGIVLNNHYINSSDDFTDGEAVLDLKMVETDPSRKIAGLLAITATAFDIPARGRTEKKMTCTLEKDIEIFAITNHMHEYGTSASARVTREAGGEPELVSDIPHWNPEMTGNPRWNMHVGDDVLKLAKGATVDVNCAWENTSATPLKFPREMCLTIGMYFATEAETRACVEGAWLDVAPAL